MTNYVYELRRGVEILATGRVQLESTPSPGDVISIGRSRVRVEAVLLGPEARLILSEP